MKTVVVVVVVVMDSNNDYDDAVESAQSDVGTHAARWARAWQASFFGLYTLVAVASLILYLLLGRAVALVSGLGVPQKNRCGGIVYLVYI